MRTFTSNPLTFDQTRGTKTFYFPVDREPGQAPQVTVMLKRAADGSLHAGIAVCSQEDNFSRRTGRRIAFHRMLGRPVIAPSSQALVGQLYEYLHQLLGRREDLVSRDVILDLEHLEGVEAAFDILDANRESRNAAAESVGC